MDELKTGFSVAWINVICAVFSSIGAFIFGFDSGTLAFYTSRTSMFLRL
jgi:hypothetical protein